MGEELVGGEVEGSGEDEEYRVEEEEEEPVLFCSFQSHLSATGQHV